MNGPVREVTFSDDPDQRVQQLVSREWLVTAGNGSYSCGTLGFVPTRRHHGMLIANLPAPQGRTMSLVQLQDELFLGDGKPLRKLWGEESVGSGLSVHGSEYLQRFRLDHGFPYWQYSINGVKIEKSIVMPHETLTVCIRYRISGAVGKAKLRLRPMIQFRGHNDRVDTQCNVRHRSTAEQSHEFDDEHFTEPLRIRIEGGSGKFVERPITDEDRFYRVEHSRGYDDSGDLSASGHFEIDLASDCEIYVFASLDDWNRIEQLDGPKTFEAEMRRRQELLWQSPEAADPIDAELILAADQFLMTPASRQSDRSDPDAAASQSARRSVIAGYPWFTDWGRDTMISLPGLTLASGRFGDARQVLLTFADYVRDGLIPNLFPEGGQQGMYHTADATLWFFQAIAEYELRSGDESLVERLLPKLGEIVECHLAGTLFGIRVDRADGLLIQGQSDVQLTWMDAKAGDWVVTPRRGKAVEINALWYNALKLYLGWLRRSGDETNTAPIERQSELARKSFNERFWYSQGGYLYDVVDGETGDDHSLRPNQLFALSLSHPVLEQDRWDPVITACVEHLLTPFGLRSLSATSPDYIGSYHGDVLKRDAAYHQGTVWSWLIGPLVKAWCRAHPQRRDEAASWLNGLESHLGEACIGQISEIFEGDPPHAPKGCFAQAWSVAELLESRCVIRGE